MVVPIGSSQCPGPLLTHRHRRPLSHALAAHQPVGRIPAARSEQKGGTPPRLQIAYISSSRGPVDQALLNDILDVSRRNNVRCGVTGLLVSGGRRFLQVLEGPGQAVLTTYARIQADTRHRAFVLISCQPVAEPAFEQWSMAHRQSGLQVADDGLEAAVRALTAKITDPNLRAQFSGFAQLHGRAA